MADGLEIPLKKRGMREMSLVLTERGIFIRRGRRLVELPGLKVKRIVLGSASMPAATNGVD